MITRDIQSILKSYYKQYPVITITGPRQAGKTTLCKATFPKKKYISLENPDQRQYAINDPKAFLNNLPDGAILDEIQRAPEIVSYIQQIIDEKNTPGIFILTGSQQFEISNTISQSLAGRTALVKLLPFSCNELINSKFSLERESILYTGGYPRIYDQKLKPTEAMAFYLETYIERDLRQLINIKELSDFERFLRICAGRAGQIVNMSSIGNDCGISYQTVKSWLSILEASYIIKLVPPYYKNLNKRLIKSPKLFFYDTGLLCYLLGITTKEQVPTHPLIGSIFENFVFTELIKSIWNNGKRTPIYFFKDKTGHEVDFIINEGLSDILFEVKYAQTIKDDFFKGLEYFNALNPDKCESRLIYGGNESFNYKNTSIFSWQKVML